LLVWYKTFKGGIFMRLQKTTYDGKELYYVRLIDIGVIFTKI